MRKHYILVGITIALLLFLIAILFYTGGSYFDPYLPGFDWQHNYLSNLFNKTAINGQPNSGRFWAIGGMLELV